jgi:hypothetical protein
MSLKEAKNYPLSDEDIRKILGPDIKIITYPELAQMSSIDQCFDDKGRCILLFLTSSPTAGHWCCLLNKEDGIHFFDPYGEKPEEQFDGLPQSRLEQLDEGQPFLTKLLRGSGLPVFYNTHDFQKDRADISTCGRHCVARCLYAPYSTEKYKSIIDRSKLSPDDFVVGLTYDKLRK